MGNKLELTWFGKDKEIKVEPRILILLIWPLDIIYDATGMMYDRIAKKIEIEQKFLQEFQKNMLSLVN